MQHNSGKPISRLVSKRASSGGDAVIKRPQIEARQTTPPLPTAKIQGGGLRMKPQEVLTDAELIEKVRGGDMDAYGKLWEHHVCSARVVAYSVGGANAVDDLVSQAYMNVFDAISNGKGPVCEFRQYLHTTIRNLNKRQGLKNKEAPIELADVKDQTASEEDDLAQTLIELENQSRVSAAFYELSERYRAAVWLSQVEGKPAQDIADYLGVSVGAAHTIIYRGKKRLQEVYFKLSEQQSDTDDDVKARDSASAKIETIQGAAVRGDSSASGLSGSAHNSKKMPTKLGKKVAGGVLGVAISVGTESGIANAVGGISGIIIPPTVSTLGLAAGAGTGFSLLGGGLFAAAITKIGAITAVAALLTGGATIAGSVLNHDARSSAAEVSGSQNGSNNDGYTHTAENESQPQQLNPMSDDKTSPASGKNEQKASSPQSSPAGGAAASARNSAPVATNPITIVATGMGNPAVCYPTLSGTGTPGSTITVQSISTKTMTAVVNASGNWVTPTISGISSGTKTFIARDPSGNTRSVTVTIADPPSLGANIVSSGRLQVIVRGIPNQMVQVIADGAVIGTVNTGAGGSVQQVLDYVPAAGSHIVSAKYFANGCSTPSTSMSTTAP